MTETWHFPHSWEFSFPTTINNFVCHLYLEVTCHLGMAKIKLFLT